MKNLQSCFFLWYLYFNFHDDTFIWVFLSFLHRLQFHERKVKQRAEVLLTQRKRTGFLPDVIQRRNFVSIKVLEFVYALNDDIGQKQQNYYIAGFGTFHNFHEIGPKPVLSNYIINLFLAAVVFLVTAHERTLPEKLFVLLWHLSDIYLLVLTLFFTFVRTFFKLWFRLNRSVNWWQQKDLGFPKLDWIGAVFLQTFWNTITIIITTLKNYYLAVWYGCWFWKSPYLVWDAHRSLCPMRTIPVWLIVIFSVDAAAWNWAKLQNNKDDSCLQKKVLSDFQSNRVVTHYLESVHSGMYDVHLTKVDQSWPQWCCERRFVVFSFFRLIEWADNKKWNSVENNLKRIVSLNSILKKIG